MENIQQTQQVQQIEQPMVPIKNPLKIWIIILSILVLSLVGILVFFFSKVTEVNDKYTSLQQELNNSKQNNNDIKEISSLAITDNNVNDTPTPSVVAVKEKMFTLAKYGGVSNISFTYPENWTLKQANKEQRIGWGAQLISPSGKLTIWMGNTVGSLEIVGVGNDTGGFTDTIGAGCEHYTGVKAAKITYYNATDISGINGYKLYTVISDNEQNRIYDSFVGSKLIDDYATTKNKELRCSINGAGIKGEQAAGYNDGATLNLNIKIIVDGLGGQSAESEQITTQTTSYIKSVIESDEYQQAKKIIMSAKMN